MSLDRFALRPGYPAALLDMFPRMTAAQLAHFNDLAATDRLVTDDGAEHPALVAWVAHVVGVRHG